MASSEDNKGLLNIDLNVALPEDGGSGSESPPPVNGQEIRSTAVASNSLEKKLSSGDEHDLDFNGIEAHWSKGETSGFDYVAEEAKQMENVKLITDSEEEDMQNRRWYALLRVAESEKSINKEEKYRSPTRRPSRVMKLGGKLRNRTTTQKKITVERRNSDGYREVLVAPMVVRSTRGRAVAMPNKYRDSVLDAVVVTVAAEAEFRRRNKSGKSAAVVPTKRKFR